MSRRSRAQISNDIQRQIAGIRKKLEVEVSEVTGANSEPVKQAAFALAREWRKTLSVPAPGLRTRLGSKKTVGDASAPGEPPHLVSGRLRRSIRTAVVDGMRRVGSNLFTARFLEFGYAGKPPFHYKQRWSRKLGEFKARREYLAGPANPPIPPRPHLAVSIERAKDRMVDALVSEIQKRLARTR